MKLLTRNFFSQSCFVLGFVFYGFLSFSQGLKIEAATDQKDSKKGGIIFNNDSWKETLTKAAKQKQLIFVDANTSWCGPCKLLKATTFRDKEVAGMFNKNFINLSIDMEKGEGINLATQWQVQAYPTLLIFDSNGKLVLEAVGFLKPKELMKFAQAAIDKKS